VILRPLVFGFDDVDKAGSLQLRLIRLYAVHRRSDFVVPSRTSADHFLNAESAGFESLSVSIGKQISASSIKPPGVRLLLKRK
jgi:hypothetical protein